MFISILALGSTGDILPYASLGHYLKRRGNEVLFITSDNYKGLISGLGLDFLGLAGDAQAIVNTSGANQLSLFRSFGKLSSGLTTLLDPEHPEIKKTDIILNQLPIGLYGYDLAEKLGIPMIQVSVMPLTPTRAFPMMGWPVRFSRLPKYNRSSFRVFEKLTWLYLRGTINQWRVDQLNLTQRPLSAYWQGGRSGRPAAIYGYSSHVLPKPHDWDDRIHICGYWFKDDEKWQPPERLTSFIDRGDPPVFIGFGSMPLSNPVKTTKMLVEAAGDSGQRVILHTGWAELGGVRLPDDILLIDGAPYRWLFPKMAAVIHHGGSGTTGSVLWSGVPSLTVPFLFDQSFWGRRLVDLGIGINPIRFKKLTSKKLSESINRLVNDPLIRTAASEIGEKVRAESGFDLAERVIIETASSY